MDSAYGLLKRIAKEVQYSVIITDIIMTIYVLWLIITNRSDWLPGLLFSWTPIGSWLLFRANKLFHLCLTHKLMLIHSSLIYFCCIYQAYIGFGLILYPMRWLMFVSGIILMIRLIIQQRHKCCI